MSSLTSGWTTAYLTTTMSFADTETTTTPSLKVSPKRRSWRRFLQDQGHLVKDELEVWDLPQQPTASTPPQSSEGLQAPPQEPLGLLRTTNSWWTQAAPIAPGTLIPLENMNAIYQAAWETHQSQLQDSVFNPSPAYTLFAGTPYSMEDTSGSQPATQQPGTYPLPSLSRTTDERRARRQARAIERRLRTHEEARQRALMLERQDLSYGGMNTPPPGHMLAQASTSNFEEPT